MKTCLLVIFAFLLSANVSAVQLITESEANLPPAADGAVKAATKRGITRAPGIRLVSPDTSVTVKSPFNLKLVFEPRGGSTIDPASVKVSYIRSPSVDLLSRVKPGLSAGGIELRAAEAPVGEHQIQVTLQDSEGRETSSVIILKVDK